MPERTAADLSSSGITFGPHPTAHARPRLSPFGATAAELQQTVIKAILELGLPTTGPPIAPARSTAPPDAAPWQDDVPSLQLAHR